MRLNFFAFSALLWLVLPGQAAADWIDEVFSPEIAVYNRGIALSNLGAHDKAIAEYDQAIRLNPEFADAYSGRGIAYRVKGDYNRAIAEFDQVVRLKPKDADAYSNRGIAYHTKGDHDRAIADYDQAISLKPKDAYYFNRGLAYQSKGDHDRAIADFDQAIRLKPEFASAYSARGIAYRKKGDQDRAIADFDQAIRLKPNGADAYSNRGIAYHTKGDHDRAIADYDQAIRLKPRDAFSSYCNRGLAYHMKGEHDRAIADYDQAIRLKPKDADVYYRRGLAYKGKGDYNRAIADFGQVIRLKPKDADARSNRGIAYRKKGEHDRAIADFDQAIRLKPKDARAYYHRGLVYKGKGDYSRALADYDQALRISPNLPDAAEMRREAVAQLEMKPLKKTERLALAVVHAAPIGKRVALVIGNGGYQTVTALRNPKNDAAAIAAELTRLGFEVMVHYDLSVASMRRTLSEFENKAAGADWALVYYAGHGMEFEGRNYLIPVDAQLAKSSDVPDETVALDRVLDRVRAAKKLRIVILDACRNNPFLSRMVIMHGQSRAMQSGLATVKPEPGEVVFYSARDGSVAADGEGEHSPFTAALLEHLSEEGLEIMRFFRKVTSTVLGSTDNKQEPFSYSRLPDEDFYFVPPNITSSLPNPAP